MTLKTTIFNLTYAYLREYVEWPKHNFQEQIQPSIQFNRFLPAIGIVIAFIWSYILFQPLSFDPILLIHVHQADLTALVHCTQSGWASCMSVVPTVGVGDMRENVECVPQSCVCLQLGPGGEDPLTPGLVLCQPGQAGPLTTVDLRVPALVLPRE